MPDDARATHLNVGTAPPCLSSAAAAHLAAKGDVPHPSINSPRRIRLTFPKEHISAEAELLEALAPHTCQAVWERLPLEGNAVHGKYSGSEIYLFFPRPFPLQPEHAGDSVQPGDIGCYRIAAGAEYGWEVAQSELCIFYDRDAQPRMPSGPVQVNLFARLIGDPAPFFDVCRRTQLEGVKLLQVERIEA
jgi:hypothetical protein